MERRAPTFANAGGGGGEGEGRRNSRGEREILSPGEGGVRGGGAREEGKILHSQGVGGKVVKGKRARSVQRSNYLTDLGVSSTRAN